MIVSVRSKLCLTVRKGHDSKGTLIVQESIKNDNMGQLWDLHHVKGTLYII